MTLETIIWIVVYVVSINVVAFGAHGWDKAQARNGGWRVSESRLLFLGLIGGSIGAFAGQRVFHHKTRKTPFQVAFWLSVVFQILFAALLFGTDLGTQIIAAIHVSPSSSS